MNALHWLFVSSMILNLVLSWMVLYAVDKSCLHAVLITSRKTDNCYHYVALIKSKSRIESVGKAHKIGLNMYPLAHGYKDHEVYVYDEIITEKTPLTPHILPPNV